MHSLKISSTSPKNIQTFFEYSQIVLALSCGFSLFCEECPFLERSMSPFTTLAESNGPPGGRPLPFRLRPFSRGRNELQPLRGKMPHPPFCQCLANFMPFCQTLAKWHFMPANANCVRDYGKTSDFRPFFAFLASFAAPKSPFQCPPKAAFNGFQCFISLFLRPLRVLLRAKCGITGFLAIFADLSPFLV